MDLTRRELVFKTAAFVGMTLFPLGRWGWAAAGEEKKRGRLVVVLLRGGPDGLNTLIPFTERAYYDRRPTIAISEPGKPGGAINLDGRFGLHPALAPLQPFWASGRLALVHASGLGPASRTHLEAQENLETGRPGVKSADGWMNRLLGALPAAPSPVKALGVGPSLPRILQGKFPAGTVSVGPRTPALISPERPQAYQAFDPLYLGNDALGKAYRDSLAARRRRMEELKEEHRAADAGAPAAKGFPHTALQVARLMRNDPAVELVFVDLGGWDTHVNQGAAEGQLANSLKGLAQGLSVLAQGLGDVFPDTAILVLSEFGRTAGENNYGGTDHGRGNVAMVLGGRVRGGKIYGEWPGLEDDRLEDNGGLAVTTDVRHVIAAVAKGQLRLGASKLKSLFPNLPEGKALPMIAP